MEIKSFVLRQGKITTGQKNALDKFYPIYGINYQTECVNLNQIFGRNNSKIIEIGFGMGHSTWQIAQATPDNDYLGVEVHAPGVGSLLNSIILHKITNLRVIRHDVVDVLKNMIADNTISGFHIYFPDPWHKKKHHKRRLINLDFVKLLCTKLRPGGYIHLATDWQDYAVWMLDVLNQFPDLINQSVSHDYVPRPDFRPITKFETRGIKLGHGVWDLIFTKIDVK